MYTATSAAVLLLASSAMAQSSTVVSIWGFGGDAADTIVASVATASPAATVFVLGCPEGSNHCAFPEDVTVTQGPSTLNYAITVAGDDILQPSGGPTPSSITYSLDCKRSASAQAVCGYTQLSLGESEVRTTTLSGTVMNSVPVTVTAGVEKLGSGSASATASATTTTTTADSTLTTSCSGKIAGLLLDCETYFLTTRSYFDRFYHYHHHHSCWHWKRLWRNRLRKLYPLRHLQDRHCFGGR